MLWIIIAALIIAADQFTKYIITLKVDYGQMIPVVKDFFYITYHVNKGAAWGMFQNGRLIFLIFTPIVAAVIVYYIFKSENRVLKLALSFVLGGAIGNLIDRIFVGGATDFLLVYIGTYPFPIFNVADSFIVMGTILLAIYMIFIYKEPVKKDNE